jgi:hypothetical protein
LKCADTSYPSSSYGDSGIHGNAGTATRAEHSCASALFICAPGRAHRLGGGSSLRTRQGESLAGRQGCPSRDGIRRKPQAKRWPDEQKPHRRRHTRMRSQISSKSHTCPEGYVVYVAGISGKVCAQYPGRSAPVHSDFRVLFAPRGAETRRQKSAEGIVECSTHSKARTGRTETEPGRSMTRMDAEAAAPMPSATWEDTRRNRGRSEVVR